MGAAGEDCGQRVRALPAVRPSCAPARAPVRAHQIKHGGACVRPPRGSARASAQTRTSAIARTRAAETRGGGGDASRRFRAAALAL